MTPQERLEFEKMKRDLENIKTVRDVSFIAELSRRLDVQGKINLAIGSMSINDLFDVDITTPTNGQVLKYTTSGVDRWINGTDNV